MSPVLDSPADVRSLLTEAFLYDIRVRVRSV